MSKVLFDVYLLILAVAVAIGLFQFKNLDSGLRLLHTLIIFTLIQESLLKFFIVSASIKYTCYHVYSIIELSIISFLFVKCVSNKNVVVKVAVLNVLWLLLAWINIRYFQKVTNLNSNMLLLESFVITSMSMIALYKILLSDYILDLLRHPYFIIWCILLIYWSATYFYWGFIEVLYRNNWHYPLIDAVQTILNIAEYAVISIAFSIKPKRIRS